MATQGKLRVKNEELKKMDILQRTVDYSLGIIKLSSIGSWKRIVLAVSWVNNCCAQARQSEQMSMKHRGGRAKLILSPKCPSHTKNLASQLTGSA